MEGRLLLIAAGIALGCAVALPAGAYDDGTTHPAITDETVTLHNRLYPHDQVSEEERQLLMRGSIEEDILPRPLNHLYDPVHHAGWSGLKAGWAPALLTRLTALVALLPDAPLASVEWIQADGAQQAYSRYGGNRSWPAALREAARGNRDGAYLRLGSALHLLQDAGVPDHARDDTHVHHVEFLTGDAGSPYEAYARKYAPGNIGIARSMGVALPGVPRYGAPQDYLEDNARYSADSFFSKDTVGDSRFPKPKVSREKDGIAYGIARDGREVPLARRVGTVAAFTGSATGLRLGDGPEFASIHEAQFRVLAERTILLGVGMIRDFREAEKSAAEEPLPTRIVLSVVGEVDRALDSVAGWLGAGAKSVAQQASRAYAWLTGSLTSVAGGNPGSGGAAGTASTPVSEIAAAPASTQKEKKVPPTKPAAGKAAASTGKGVSEVANCPASGPEEIVISEVAWMGTAASANDEWIELANGEGEAVMLEGWELSSSDGNLYVDLDAVTVPAHGFVLLERTDDTSVPGIGASAIYVGALANVPGEGYALELRAAGCGVADRAEAASGWPAGDAASRRTMERAGSRWQTSALPGGTPGRANSAGFVKASTSTKQVAATTTEREPDQDEEEDEEMSFVIDTGRVVLSEIQAAGEDAGDEFVELYNPGSRSVSLEGWSLQYFAATETAQAQKRDLPAVSIPANGYLLVARGASDGEEGYRGTVAADYRHRSFSLSGAGATVALVRGNARVASTSVAAVVDWVRYPKLLPHESYERAAQGSGGCLDPRPGMPGRFLGNGCESAVWYVRALAEPQNRASLTEPRTDAEEQATTTTSTDPVGDPEEDAISWIALPATGYRANEEAPSWKLLTLLRGDAQPPAEVTSGTQLVPQGVDAITLRYAGCAGAEVFRKFFLLPLTPNACQAGGPLSSAFKGNFWEDGIVLVKALGNLVAGEVLQLVEYAFSGGGFEQRFSLVSSSTIIAPEGLGELPTAPHALAYQDGSLPVVRITWQSAMDLDSVDEELSYEVRVARSGEVGSWENASRALFTDKELMPGTYAISVRAVDPQGNRGPEADLGITILEPEGSEQFEHVDDLLPGSGTLRIPAATRLAGIAVWLVPGGGPYCCSIPELTITDAEGGVLGTATAGRRVVDGEGDTPLLFPQPVELGAGSYQIAIRNADSLSNRFVLRGLSSGGDWNGSGALYLRLVPAD